jgi:hypothetical protein
MPSAPQGQWYMRKLWNPEINSIIESLNTASSMLENAEGDACKDWMKLLQKRIGYLEKDEKELKSLWIKYRGYEYAREAAPTEAQGKNLCAWGTEAHYC